MKKALKNTINTIIEKLDMSPVEFSIEHPADPQYGDYSCNVAMVAAKTVGKNPKEFADEIKAALEAKLPAHVEKIEIAGPGFINFYVSPEFFAEQVQDILEKGSQYGMNTQLSNERILFEFTDPNPFKQFHIGHLMNNAVGESVSRLLEANGADVIRANYQGDVGPHVAKAIYGMLKNKKAFPQDTDTLADKTKFLGDAYVSAEQLYQTDESVKAEIDSLNKQIYDTKSGVVEAKDEDIETAYEKGRQWSLEHFEEIYKKLDTSFDHYIFESNTFERGQNIVREQLEKGVFEESDGAIIFKGDDYGLHTRVFISSIGTPTYEAKDVGLAFHKEELETFDRSYIVTASEQTEYFKVVYKAIEQFAPEIAAKTKHVEHGMMRFADGKMSSRKGNVITGESLLRDLENVVFEKMTDRENITDEEKSGIASQVAVGALKYSILKQSPGKNITFDRETALSTEGDSGPYVQYTIVRANSVLKKAQEEGIKAAMSNQTVAPGQLSDSTLPLLRQLYQFPEIISHAYTELAPQHLVTYATELAGLFNSFYANNQIVDNDDESSAYKIALTEAVAVVLTNALKILAIPIPEKM